jgi:1-acyl-sn-glycerol-3-phosphate acyltransferase
MIKAKHSRLYTRLFEIYINIFINIAFRNIRIIGDSNIENGLPTLMIANHFSWWDGFIQMHLNLKTFRKKFHFMMLEEEMSKSRIFRKVGGCSVSKGSRGILKTLQHLVSVIKEPGNLYLFFPQGKIESLYSYPYKFEKGALQYIIKHVKNDYQFVFNVNLIDYSSHKRPELSIYYKTYNLTNATTPEQIENDFNEFANSCLTKQKSE